jgi:hypothetical protein
MNGVFIIPTGLACTLGGDAAFNPGVKLIAQCCDRLIVNPNAVNASDINEMPDNCLYTEGSLIDRFLAGEINLRLVKGFNRILMVVNRPWAPANLNAAAAGIWGMGADVQVEELNTPLIMAARVNPDGTAGGDVLGWEALVEQVQGWRFDALAIHTPIDCPQEVADHYWANGGVNPWGAVEAIASKLIASALDKPVAHAPVDFLAEPLFNQIVVKRSMAPEIISNTYAFCILKGLHRAPRVDNGRDPRNLSNWDMDFLVTPMNCWGPPHWACLTAGIPIIVVQENTTCLDSGVYPETVRGTGRLIFARNYLEAAGIIMSMRAGVDHRTVVLPDVPK